MRTQQRVGNVAASAYGHDKSLTIFSGVAGLQVFLGTLLNL